MACLGRGKRSLVLGICGIVLAGCGESAPPVASLPPPPVTVSLPIVRTIVDYDQYEGRIEAVEKVDIRARVRGYLTKVDFQDGQLVKEGDLLFEIDPRPYQATLDQYEAQAAQHEAGVKLAEVEYQRYEQLLKTKAASKSDYDKALGLRDEAVAGLAAARASIEQAKLDLGFTKIASPITGKVGRRLIDIGNLIDPTSAETPLTTIVSVDPIHVLFNVDERSMMRYRSNKRDIPRSDNEVPTIKDLKIPVYVGLDGEEGFPHEGMLDFTDNKVNPSTGTILVRGVLANPTRILDDGMRARVRVPVSEPREAIQVTERAIGTDQGLKFVYVVNDKNVVERRDVVLGRVVDGLQVVESGIQPTDKIIVNGIQRVRDAMTVQPIEGPMPDTEGLSQAPPLPTNAEASKDEPAPVEKNKAD